MIKYCCSAILPLPILGTELKKIPEELKLGRAEGWVTTPRSKVLQQGVVMLQGILPQGDGPGGSPLFGEVDGPFLNSCR